MSEKSCDQFRDYTSCPEYVINTYRTNHKFQTVDFVKEQHKKFFSTEAKILSIWDAIELLNDIKDESDPDLTQHQTVHAYQTAEGLRKLYPQHDWLHLVGFIHDLGKIIAHPNFGNQPQWCTVGDTFPVGCAFRDSIVFNELFSENPDYVNPDYNSLYGMYQPKCGLDNLLFSFGHDEYLYQVLKRNKCKIHELGLQIIRYHSFYPWHKENDYEHFMNETDYELRDWVKTFSNCDLYTKDDHQKPNIDELKPYYQKLVEKYFDSEVLKF